MHRSQERTRRLLLPPRRALILNTSFPALLHKVLADDRHRAVRKLEAVVAAQGNGCLDVYAGGRDLPQADVQKEGIVLLYALAVGDL